MQLLLDTHALIWWLSKDSRLSTRAYEEIANPQNLVFFSAASAWEIAIKKSLKKGFTMLKNLNTITTHLNDD